MPTVLDWNPTVDPSELASIICASAAEGSAIVLPGDCGYVVVVNPAAATAETLLNRFDSPPAILTWEPGDPEGLGLRISQAVRRLLKRGWPSPLIVEVPGRAEWPEHWPTKVRERLAERPARFRCPEHPVFEVIAPTAGMPLLVVDTYLPTAEAVLDVLDDESALAISAGRPGAEGKPTIVTATANGYEIVEPGLMPADEVEKLAARVVLFVCTGNTCRSPLAEGLAKKVLAERLECSTEELPRRGVWVLSAGVSTYGESPATAEAVIVAAELGADLGEHRSRPLNAELLAAADDVVAMTRGHAQALMSRYPGIGPAPRLLCGNADLPDPIGAGLDVYRQCAQAIRAHLERFIPEWTGQ